MYVDGKAGKLFVNHISDESPKGAVVFAHGMCHGAWWWDRMQEHFRSHGYDSYALSYRGHYGVDGKDSDGYEELQKWTI